MHVVRWLVPSLALAALVSPFAFARDDAPAASAAPRPSTPPAQTKTLRFTGIPTQNTTELAAKYAPLAKHLAEKLGIQVEYVPSADYNASVDAFVNGDIQLCWFGGFTGVQARDRVEGARVIACGKVDREFKSYFVANAALGLKKSDEFPMALKGKKFTFGSDKSTSGRLMPEYFIRKFTKQTPKEFFGSEMNFSGGHDKTAKLVEAGTFDAGALDFTIYDRMVKEFAKDPSKGVDPAKCQVVWVTPTYVDYNFTAHPRLEELFGNGFIEKLQAALVAISDPELLKPLERPEGLVKASNEDFDGLRGVIKELFKR